MMKQKIKLSNNQLNDDRPKLMIKATRNRLLSLEHKTLLKKKQIITRLAERLDGIIIPTDTICMKISQELKDIISERFIRECLPEKYKQAHRVQNARCQSKGRRIRTRQEIEDKIEKYKDRMRNMTLMEANGGLQELIIIRLEMLEWVLGEKELDEK